MPAGAAAAAATTTAQVGIAGIARSDGERGGEEENEPASDGGGFGAVGRGIGTNKWLFGAE